MNATTSTRALMNAAYDEALEHATDLITENALSHASDVDDLELLRGDVLNGLADDRDYRSLTADALREITAEAIQAALDA